MQRRPEPAVLPEGGVGALLTGHRAAPVCLPSLLGRKGGGRPGALGRQEPECQGVAPGLLVQRPPRGPGRATARDTRNRLVVRRVNAVSVLKVSLIFYFGVLIVMLIAGTVLWNVAAALGVIDDLNKAIRSLFALSTFKLHPLVALGWSALIGGALCFLGVLVNVFAAIMYNLISDIVGGVQVTVAADKQRLSPPCNLECPAGPQALRPPVPGAIAQPVRAQH